MTLVSPRFLGVLAILSASCGSASVSAPPGPDGATSSGTDGGAVGADATAVSSDAAGPSIDSGAAEDAGSDQADATSQPDAASPPEDAGGGGGDAGAAAPDAGAAVTTGTPAELYAAASTTCANMPLRTTGTILYFCDCQAGSQNGCAPGDDSNPGTSPSAPKQSFGAAIAAFNAMNAGDTVALCKGGLWNIPSGTDIASADCGYAPALPPLSNPRCWAGTSLTDPANPSTCDLRDYQAPWGGTARPVLFAYQTGPVRIIKHGYASTSGVRVMNLELRGSDDGPEDVGSSYNQTGIGVSMCAASTTHSWLVCNNDFNHLRLGLHWNSYDQQGTTRGAQSDWLVLGNRFTMNELDAILGGTGSNTRIDANYFDNNGCWFTPYAYRAHTLYVGGPQGQTNVEVVNNQFLYTGTPNNPTCEAGLVVGHDFIDGLIFENNVIDSGVTENSTGYPGNAWGVDFRASYSGPTDFRNMRIRRNWIRTGGLGISVGQAPDSIIENNVIVLPGPSTWKVGIASPSETPNEMRDLRRWGDAQQHNLTVRNNTVYITGSGALAGIIVGTEGTGHVVANNVVHAPMGTCFSTGIAGRFSVTGAVAPGDSVTINGYTLTALNDPPGEADDDPAACTASCDHTWDVQGATPAQVARDLAAAINASTRTWFLVASNDETDGYVSLADWGAGPSNTGQGTGYTVSVNSAAITWTPRDASGAPFYAFVGNNACSGGAAWGTPLDATMHVTTDPLFASPPANFTPRAGSPLIGGGSAAHAPGTDFVLKTRPNPPSIGAMEP